MQRSCVGAGASCALCGHVRASVGDEMRLAAYLWSCQGLRPDRCEALALNAHMCLCCHERLAGRRASPLTRRQVNVWPVPLLAADLPVPGSEDDLLRSGHRAPRRDRRPGHHRRRACHPGTLVLEAVHCIGGCYCTAPRHLLKFHTCTLTTYLGCVYSTMAKMVGLTSVVL